jgi:hypothetical protein
MAIAVAIFTYVSAHSSPELDERFLQLNALSVCAPDDA